MTVACLKLKRIETLRCCGDFVRGVFFPLLFVSMLFGCASAQTDDDKGSVEGPVIVLDSEGPSYVPGATVTLEGAKPLQAETDEKGQYSFQGIEPGQYKLVATFPGLQADQEITVTSGATLKIELQLKPVSVQTSVTVSETTADTTAPVATETITQKT